MPQLSVLHVGELGAALSETPFKMTTASTIEAPRAVVSGTFDAVVIDLRMANGEALDAVAEIHALAPAVPIVVTGPVDHHDRAVQALREGAHDILLDDEDSVAVLTHLVRTARARMDIDEARTFLAKHDRLTGTASGPVFRDRLNSAMSRAVRSKSPMALVDMDVDGIAEINATLGHDAGDEVLRTVAARLMAAVREVDTVSRQGGDEFLVLLENVGSRADARKVVNRLTQSVRLPITIAGQRVVPTLGSGVAVWPDHASTLEQLRDAALAALRYAKRSGPDEISFAPSLPAPERRSRRVQPRG